MKEMDEKLVIFNHLYHFTALNPQIGLEVLNTYVLSELVHLEFPQNEYIWY
jgi:hypothetical protein